MNLKKDSLALLEGGGGEREGGREEATMEYKATA